MTRRKESGIQAQIIAGRDGKPSHAVVSVEVFLALAALARKGVEASDKTPHRINYALLEKEDLAYFVQSLRKTFYVGETSSSFKNRLESLLSDKNMEKTFKHVREWLLSEWNTAAHSAVDEEEDEDVAAYDAARARDEESFSEEVADRLIAGENPIKVFREFRGWTQQELSEKAGTTAPYLSQIETGRRTGSVKLLHRLADALRVELDDLV